jgi:hypothetical protein
MWEPTIHTRTQGGSQTPRQVAMFDFVSLSHRYSCNVAHPRVYPLSDQISSQVTPVPGRTQHCVASGRGLKTTPRFPKLGTAHGVRCRWRPGSPPQPHPECRPRLQGVREKCRPTLAPNGGRTRATASLLPRRRVPWTSALHLSPPVHRSSWEAHHSLEPGQEKQVEILPESDPRRPE